MSVLFTVLLSTNLSGQGSVAGVVTGAEGETLIAASVFVPGTTKGNFTDLDGGYRLSLPAGTYEIQASYIGYEASSQEVVIIDGKTAKLDFVLATANMFGEEVVVTAQMMGQRSAISQQLNADGIVNVVSEEQIQELPDANAAESIGRLPGVSLKRSGGEANKVVLRGLSDKFSLITLNGVPIPATDANSRGVDLSMFSQSSLAGIEVTKAVTADMDADAIAGAVNLVTRKAPEEREFRVDLGGGYNRLEKDFGQYRVDVRYGRRILNNKLGVQASVNNERLIRSRESFSQGWQIDADSSTQITDLGVNYVDETRGRLGGNLLLDYDTGDGGTIRFNNFYTQTSRDRITSSRDYPVTGDVNYNISDTETINSTLNNSLSGENFLGNGIEITWNLSHAQSVGRSPYDYSMNFQEGGAPETGMRNVPNELLDGPGQALIPLAYNNFRQAFLYGARFSDAENRDRDFIGTVNVKKSFSLSETINGSFKTGAKIRQKRRTREADSQQSLDYLGLPKTFVQLPNGDIVPQDFSATSFNDFTKVGGSNVSLVNFLDATPAQRELLDQYALNPLVNPELAREWAEITRNAVNQQGELFQYVEDLQARTGNYDIQERIYSAYVMTTLDIGEKLRVIGGLRFEREDNEYQGIYAPELGGILRADPSVLQDTTSSYAANYVLPNLHLRYKPEEWFDLRFAATKTLARPDFAMRLPRLEIDRVNRTVSRGNTTIESTVAWNYDVIASFYQSKYGLFTAGVFYKALDNSFYNLNNRRILTQASADELALPTERGTLVGFNLSEPINTDDTKVYGVEFDLQANLRFLPGVLKNLVFRANYSRIQSETNYPRVRIDQDNSEFPPTQTVVQFTEQGKLEGQPENFGNVALGYDLGGFSSRLSVFFQDDFLTTVTSTGLREQSEKGFSKWDFVVSQEIKKIKLIFNVNNITNFSEGQFYNFRGLDRGESKFGVQVDFRVRYTL